MHQQTSPDTKPAALHMIFEPLIRTVLLYTTLQKPNSQVHAVGHARLAENI